MNGILNLIADPDSSELRIEIAHDVLRYRTLTKDHFFQTLLPLLRWMMVSPVDGEKADMEERFHQEVWEKLVAYRCESEFASLRRIVNLSEIGIQWDGVEQHYIVLVNTIHTDMDFTPILKEYHEFQRSNKGILSLGFKAGLLYTFKDFQYIVQLFMGYAIPLKSHDLTTNYIFYRPVKISDDTIIKRNI